MYVVDGGDNQCKQKQGENTLNPEFNALKEL
jgi:hypothetical protein